MTKVNLKKDKSNNDLSTINKKELAKELINYFPHLKKSLTKEIINNEYDLFLLKDLLEKYKKCKDLDQCNDSKYHDIPYVEKDENGSYLYVKREPCKNNNEYYLNKWKSFFIVDDYIGKVNDDISVSFANAKDADVNSDTLDLLIKYMYDKKTNKYDKLSSFFIVNEDVDSIKEIFYSYAIKQARNDVSVSFINLINLFTAYKNRYNDSKKIDKYNYAFDNCKLFIFSDIDLINSDENSWMYLFSVISSLIKRNRYLIFITRISFQQILNNILDNSKVNVFSIAKQTLELIQNLND